MSLASAVVLLQTALSLLTLVNSNPSLPQSMRDNATAVAEQAITQATAAIAASKTITASSPQSAPSTVLSVSSNPQTLCNGSYYYSCPIGQDFVCPSSGGKAYCLPNTATLAAEDQQAAQQQASQQQDREAKLASLESQYNQAINEINTVCNNADAGRAVITCENAESKLQPILQQEALIGITSQEAAPQLSVLKDLRNKLQDSYYKEAPQAIPVGDIQARQANIASESQIILEDVAMFNSQ